MLLIIARDEIAKAIHESRYPNGDNTWDKLPGSPKNPQRYYARLAADAVLKLLGAEESVVDGFMQIETEIGATPVAQAVKEASK